MAACIQTLNHSLLTREVMDKNRVFSSEKGGVVVENPRALKPALRSLRRLEQAIARSRDMHGRTETSNRRERLYARRRRLHARMVNVRNDVHHKATTAVAKPAGRVVTEDLNVAGMMSNRRLSRALADAGLSGFLN